MSIIFLTNLLCEMYDFFRRITDYFSFTCDGISIALYNVLLTKL